MPRTRVSITTPAVSRLCPERDVPALGEVRLGELTPAIIDRALGLVRVTHSPQTARAARRALSSLCNDAVRHGAISQNPVRDSRPIVCPRRPVRALSVGEMVDLQARLGADADALRWDLPDLVQFMLGTGVRIGEATAVRRAVLDLEAGTVHINATVVRVLGQGLRIQPRTKTTQLDDAGFSIRHIADQLGHARPSTTLDHYLGRRAVTTADFATALTVLANPA